MCIGLYFFFSFWFFFQFVQFQYYNDKNWFFLSCFGSKWENTHYSFLRRQHTISSHSLFTYIILVITHGVQANVMCFSYLSFVSLHFIWQIVSVEWFCLFALYVVWCCCHLKFYIFLFLRIYIILERNNENNIKQEVFKLI